MTATIYTWKDVKETNNEQKEVEMCEDARGEYMRINLSQKRRFLFVNDRGIDLREATPTDIRCLLEEVNGKEYATQVYLENIPNKYGSSHMISRSVGYAIVDNEKLSTECGIGGTILKECMETNVRDHYGTMQHRHEGRDYWHPVARCHVEDEDSLEGGQ